LSSFLITAVFVASLGLPDFNRFFDTHLAQATTETIDTITHKLAVSEALLETKRFDQQALKDKRLSLAHEITQANDSNTQIALRKEFHRVEAQEYAVARDIKALVTQIETHKAELKSSKAGDAGN